MIKHYNTVFFIIPLLVIIVTFSSCYQPDKDTVKRLVWQLEMQEKMDKLVKSQYNQTKEDCQAYFESEKEKQERNPFIQSLLSSDNFWSDAIQNRLDSTYQSKTDSILQEVDIYNDRIIEMYTFVIDHWDFSYDTKSKRIDNIFTIDEDINTHKDSLNIMTEFVFQHAERIPDISKPEEIEDNHWVYTNYNDGYEYLITRDDDDNLNCQFYSK